MKIPIAIILDNHSLARWQQDALDHVKEYLEVKLILNCQNTKNQRNLFQHFIYYVINFFSLKNTLSSCVEYENTNHSETINFSSKYKGSWQIIPENIANKILENDIKLVIKFGMSLLAINDSLQKIDILSFHHGDPEKYRGRPAGFYEIYHDADKVGIIVQKLSNTLDGGEVYAKGYSKIFNYSYKKTALNFFSNSKYIFKHAIVNYISNKPIKQKNLGENFRLPSNSTSIKFLFKILKEKCIRYIYGAFFEKKWNIAKLSKNVFELHNNQIFDISKAVFPIIKDEYSFYADPFFSSDGSIVRAEGLNKSTGLGEIIELDSNDLEFNDVILKGGHLSYPFSIDYQGVEYLLPETSSNSNQIILPNPKDLQSKIPLSGIEDLRIVDATIVKYDDLYFLFGGMSDTSMDCLHLFYSNSLFGEYKKHPLNPIVIDPSSARMGGKILFMDDSIYRFGQNNSYGYGQSLSVMKIHHLSREGYSEKKVSEISLKGALGPHTINLQNQEIIIDFYREEFNIFAGYKRIAGLINKKI